MATYTVTDKNTGDQLTAAEFNQIKDALADGTITINPESLQIQGTEIVSSSLNILNINDVKADSATADSSAGFTIKTSGGSNVATFGAGGSPGVTFEGGLVFNGQLNANDQNLINIKLAEFQEEHDNGNTSTAQTIDWNNGNNQKSTLTGNCTFTFTAPSGPSRLQLKLVQDATGSRTVTWPTIKWVGGVAPTLSTAANSEDIVVLFYDGTSYYGVHNGGFA